MDVKQAVRLAKEHIAFLLEDEGIVNVGLEEVEFKEEAGEWEITIGFSRPWDVPESPSKVMEVLARQGSHLNRTYKVLRLKDDDEKVISVKDREFSGHYNGY
jgi:uncharacterized protein YdeI (YjbR/CyaY-like superfamily)